VTQDAPSSHPPTLLLHDGELADVHELLGSLGKSFVERCGPLLPQDGEEAWELVVVTPRRALDPELINMHPRPSMIAICDRDSRTLRTSLRRAGVQKMVRRPVHPAALRALLLHALYRGPERRRTARVSVGAPVGLRLGLRKRNAILADLSIGGCRILSAHELEPGGAIKLSIPAEIAGGKVLSLRGRVLRRLEQAAGDPAYAIKFERPNLQRCEQLQRTIESHAGGPAKLAAEAKIAASQPEPTPIAPAEVEAKPELPVPGNTAASPPESEEAFEAERAESALAEEAERVLMGREISISGMRVDPSPLLGLGDDVRLAIHAGSQEQPLVVTAKVHRDEGDRGVVLRFHQLDPVASKLLDEVLDELPVIEPSRRDSGAGMIVSEILASTV
jgi:hypothetical protein